MKKLCTFVAFMLMAASLLAKPITDTVIKRDTINLRGYVYDEQGKPVKQLHIQSTQKDVQYNLYKVNGWTDTSGYFELRGAKFNDTLTIAPLQNYNTPPIYNKNSRYIVIYLSAKVIDLNSSAPIAIPHKREHPIITPTFKIKAFEGTIDYFEVHIPPRFRAGYQKFEDFIKNNLAYPENAIKNNAEGTVEVEFTVEKDGSLADFKLLKGVGYGCDEEVINVLRKSPGWQPAIDNGRPTPVKQTVSVSFALTDK